MPTKTHPLRPRPVFALLALLVGLLLAGPRAVPSAQVTAYHPAARAASPASFNPPGGNAGAAVAWAIGLASSLIYVLGYFAKYLPQRQRELFAMYRRSAGTVCGLGRRACARVFGDKAMQRRLLNPACPLSEEWAAVRDALAQAGAAPETLASPEPFYADLLTQMQLSEFWRDRAGALATHLRALMAPTTETEPEANAPAPVPQDAPDRAEDAPGVATFLFTDIQDSTVHWETLGQRFGPVKEQHDRLLRALAARFHGREVVTTGDGFFFVFPTGSLAINFSIALQQATPTDPALAAALAPVADTLPGGIKVRVGMHSGERVGGDPGTFDGPNTNKAARICGAGHGGQILVSRDTFLDARLNLPPETTGVGLGRFRLKGIEDDVDILQVDDPRLPERHFPRLNAASPERVHLPRFLTPFLGRRDDVEKLQRLLAEEDTRLVALTGPAGVGKTRLSVQAAEGAAEFYPDGVWFIDLDTALEPADVFRRIVLRLSLSPGAQETDAQRVCTSLADKRMLLVLDNLEQIAHPDEALHTLLGASPSLKCLGSSRERIRVSGAQTFAVSPMPVPEASFAGDVEALRAVESVEFFVARARSHTQDFAVTADNAEAVAGLCRQLEGMPLTLELAAAWVTQLTPAEVLREIETHLDLLQSEYGDLPERQRTVRASLDWSYGRLPPEEQRLFAQISVFDGDFTREAAEAVCDSPQLTGHLRGLVEKSLVKRQELRQESRYRLLNTTRLYAAERLDELPDAAQVRERHARYYARFAATQLAYLRTAGEADAFQSIEEELDNLRGALRWSARSGPPTLTAELALALGTLLSRRGRQREARPPIEQGLQVLGQAGDEESPLFADLLRARAGLALDAFEFPQARADARRLQALAGTLGQPLLLSRAENLLGIADRCEKRYEEAAAHFRAALARLEEQGDVAEVAGVKNNLGVTLMEDPAGDRAEAESRLSEALALSRSGGDRRGVAEALTNLGNLRELARDLDGAESCYAEALSTEREIQDTSGIARALSNLGEVAEAQGRLEAAFRLYAAAEYLFGQAGSPYQSYARGLLERVFTQRPSFWDGEQSAFQSAAAKSGGALAAWATAGEAYPQEPLQANEAT